MLDEKSIQFYRILKEYYFLRMSQREIAKLENLSTATVSRMINRAIEKGYVSFTLNLPVLTVSDLEQTIKDRYGLETVSVARVDVDNPELIARDVSGLTASYLNRIIRQGDVVGISWGNTLSKVVEWLKPKQVDGVTVVGLNGSVSKNVSDTGAENIIKKFSDNYHASGYSIPFPSFVDNENIVASIKSDSNIKKVFDLIDRTRILIFSVGCIREDSVLVRAGYFEKEDYRELRRQGYVGDICSRYFKEDGSYTDDELYRRVIGIDLDSVRRKEKRVCVAMEAEKAESLRGALKGGYITSLFLDELTARKLVELES